jgi:dUTP pyrophosphatase
MLTSILTIEPINNQENIPKRATPGSAGLDVYARETCLIEPGKTSLIPLGFKMELHDTNLFAMLFARSSLHKKSLIIPNGVGIIDNDYRGEVMMLLHNISNTTDVIINWGERIGQLVIMPIIPVDINIGTVGTTKRGSGGFGSTGSY